MRTIGNIIGGVGIIVWMIFCLKIGWTVLTFLWNAMPF